MTSAARRERPVVVYVPRESIALVARYTEAEARAAALLHGNPLARPRPVGPAGAADDPAPRRRRR